MEVVFFDKEEEEVFFDNEDKEVEDIFINLDNIDLDNILFVFFQVSVW